MRRTDSLLWRWEALGAEGEGDDRGWDGWMASLTWWTWVWVNSGSWWWTGRRGVLWFMGSQRVGHDWVNEWDWTDWACRFEVFKHLKCIGSVTQLCLTLCMPMDCSMPGFPVDHQLPEFTQIHVHWGSEAIQPSHPLSFPSSPAFNLSQHQGLFQWVSSSHQVAKVLELQL